VNSQAPHPAIQSPELLTQKQRRREIALTGLMWAIYVYLWTPLLSMLAWLVGFDFAYEVMIRAGGVDALKQVIWWYTAAVASILLLTTSWSFSNRYRFRNKNRRSVVSDVADQSLMDWFGVSPTQLNHMREDRRVSIDFDQQGQIGSISGATSPAARTGQTQSPG
jgi:biofilm PGA synthesis protein PgaD